METPDRQPRRWKKFALPILVLIAAYAIFQYMIANPPEIRQRELPSHYPTVEVIEANPETVTLTVHAQGTVTPRSEMSLKPEVSGRVTWLSDQLVNGGIFDKGNKLLEIDPTDYRAELAAARTELARAEAELEHARREYRRIHSLKQRQLASDADVDKARRELRIAEARQQEATIRLEQAKTNLERTTIHAPFTGRVSKESVDTGQFLTRGEVVAHLYATDYYEVHLPLGIENFLYLDLPPDTRGMIPEAYAPQVTITGRIGPYEYHWQGRLVRTEGEIDARTRLVYGVVQVANTRAEGQMPLLVGLFVRAAIEGRQVEGIVRLPRRALRDGQQVLVVDEESRLRFRHVDVLRVQQEDVLVRAGLKAGETVCVTPLAVAVDGMKVNTAPLNESSGA